MDVERGKGSRRGGGSDWFRGGRQLLKAGSSLCVQSQLTRMIKKYAWPVRHCITAV